MAIFQGSLMSKAMGMETGLTVYLPYDRVYQGEDYPCKVMYLLHGMGDNHSSWIRFSNVERYAREYGIALIMPEVQKSFYTDMTFGYPYFQYVTQELPMYCDKMFQISQRKEDTFIAGLSMGGYGALKCAMSCPGQYAGAASFSGVMDIHLLLEQAATPRDISIIKGLYGTELEIAPENNLYALGKNMVSLSPKERPKLFLTCGTQDSLYQDNLKYWAYLKEISLPAQTKDWEGGHDWTFWDQSVQEALQFFHKFE